MPKPATTQATTGVLRAATGVLLVATVASLVIYHRVWADPTGRTVGDPGRFSDQVQSIWFLKWVPWQLVHGHNPFRATAIDYPYGVNLSWNTATPTLGIVLAPVTALLGPAFSYNLLMTIAPALASTTGFLWLRRHVASPAAAAIGGGVIGFSPYVSGHLRGHLHLSFIALVPVLLMLTEDLLWRHPRPARRTSVYLGLVAAAQLGVGEEVLVVVVIGVVVALGARLVVDRHGVGGALRSAAAPLAVAVLVALAVAAPLLVEQFVGGGAIHMDNNHWRATLSDYLSPSGNQLVSLPSFGRHNVGMAELAVYVGWPLLVVLIVGVIADRRARSTRCAALTLTVLVLMTFGDVHWLGVPLPWHFIGKLPLLSGVLPLRIALATWLVVAWLLARWVDVLLPLLRSGTPRPRTPRPGTPAGIAAVAAVAIAIALIPLLPATASSAALPATPQFFTERHRDLPDGAAIVVLPCASPRDPLAMYWQQRADFRFRMLGGYAYNDSGSLWPRQTPLARVAELRTTAPADVQAARAELTRDGYRAIVVAMGRSDTPQLLNAAALLTGRAADRIDGDVSLWLLR